ncbi:hypothetical protein Vretifemale_5983, partial [Volvox reticuliferus]
MPSGCSDGDFVATSSLVGKDASFSAMPKLPPRPSATKENSHVADCTCGKSEPRADGTSNGGEPATAPVTAGAAHGAAAEDPASGSSNATTAASSIPSSRPTAGPSLPPRTAIIRSRTTTTATTATTSNSSTGSSISISNNSAASASASASSSSAGAPSATAAKSSAGTSGADSGSSSGGGSCTAKAESPAPAKTGPASPKGSGGGAASSSGLSGLRKAPMGGLSGLPPRPAPSTGPVLDPDEPESLAEVRRSIHAVRVQMISAALRLGYDHENALVKQVLYRLLLAERLKAPWHRAGKRPDPVAAAAREAARREEEAVRGAGPGPGSARGGPAAASAPTSASTRTRGGPGVGGSGAAELPPLGFTVKIMLIGLQGSGKTQLAHALLGPVGRPHTAVHPFTGATHRVTVMRGSAHGIGLAFIDTPGLSLAPGGAARNCQVLQQIRRAYHAHRPDLLVYVDRLDAPTPAAGPSSGPGAASPGGAGAELAVLRNLTAALGPAMWLNTIVTFTHAGAPPPRSSRGPATPRSGTDPAVAHTGPSFENWLEIRSHALQGVIRQASYDERLMNPVAFAESHPSCPTNTAGQPVIYNGMPWRSHLLLMLTSAKLLADTE